MHFITAGETFTVDMQTCNGARTLVSLSSGWIIGASKQTKPSHEALTPARDYQWYQRAPCRG